MLKSYNLMAKLYSTKDDSDIDHKDITADITADITVDIAFLITGSATKKIKNTNCITEKTNNNRRRKLAETNSTQAKNIKTNTYWYWEKYFNKVVFEKENFQLVFK